MEERKEIKEEIKENGSSENPNPARTSTEGTRTGTRGRGTGRGTESTEGKPTEKNNEVAVVEKETAKERNEKRKEKYKKKLEERKKAGITQGEPVKVNPVSEVEKPEEKPEEKPKKKTRKKKAELVSADDLDNLFMPIFGLVASRPNMEHWAVSKKEIHSITVPLANIIQKNDNLSKLATNTDELALIIACISLFLPRMTVTVKQVKENKKNGKPETTSVGNKLSETRKSETGIKQDVGKPSTDGTGNDGILSSIGQPII